MFKGLPTFTFATPCFQAESSHQQFISLCPYLALFSFSLPVIELVKELLISQPLNRDKINFHFTFSKFFLTKGWGSVGMGSTGLSKPIDFQRSVLDRVNFWEYPIDIRYFGSLTAYGQIIYMFQGDLEHINLKFLRFLERMIIGQLE